MATYQALYRKFRPSRFSEVKGQDAIVKTLKNQIINERIAHAYLFCGTRGTGKTSIAKLFAKAVNCENPIEGSPCGECPVCKGIAAGTSMNVIEMDAASNNGVEDIRNIVEEVSYSPTEGKYKVYIIDEVHMLSTAAFNALLKTLEEPPSYVIFILATTEAHKIPITILSRCQRYDFKRITISTIASRMRELMDAEGVEVEDKALEFVAKCADGSMRDALSLLDQCIAFYLGEKLTYDRALEVLGAVDTEVYSSLLRSVIDENVKDAIAVLEDIVMKGRDLSQFVADFTWYLRNLLLIKTSDDMETLIDMSSENLARLKEEGSMVQADSLMRYIRIFSELSGEIKYSSQKRILIEVALIKLCKPQMEIDLTSLKERIRVLEEKVERSDIDPKKLQQMIAQSGISISSSDVAPVKKVELPKALPEDVKDVAGKWGMIVANVEDGGARAFLQKAQPSVDGEQLVVVFNDALSEDYFTKLEGVELLKATISEQVGKDVSIATRHVPEGKVYDECFPDMSSIINMEIEIEEE